MRFMEKIASEICNEENIKMESFCDGYCLKLSKNNKTSYIYDNLFSNNNASTCKILNDKSAVYELLSKQNIPCTEHYYFYSTSLQNASTINTINNLLEKHKILVVKPNEGANGTDVFLAKNKEDLIQLSTQIFKKSKSITISPFYEIKHEYRVIMLNGNVELIFDKIRPFVIGNGKDNIQKLVENIYKNQIIMDKDIDIKLVPKLNEKITLNWRHNLHFGAIPEIVTDKKIIAKVSEIALNAYNLLKFNFASVDIIETSDGKLQVLEINASVCMGKFASFSEENYKLAKEIYKKAILNNLK